MTTAAAGAGSTPPERCDLAVVGGGIIGLAVARELARRHPRRRVCVLEREAQLATHQSTHNSGVVHAGIYYTPGSLKARLCVEGAAELRAYCEAREIPLHVGGKLVVALERRELPRLEELARRAVLNGVPGVRMLLHAAEIEAVEPHARGIAALHSPATAVVDFARVALALARDLQEDGGTVATGCEVRAVRRAAGRALHLVHSRGATETGFAVFCAGAWADRLAVAAGASGDPRIVPFRGSYLRVGGEAAHAVRSLVYPVPDPALPFLGVHLTRTIGGELLIGPTAVLAGARDGYDARRLRGRDLLETMAWPGTWRMLWSHRGAGLAELRRSGAGPTSLAAEAARYVPALAGAALEPALAGVRAQALGRDGRLLDDFSFSATDRALHVRNAPSPAATASLAIARHIAEEAQRTFDL